MFKNFIQAKNKLNQASHMRTPLFTKQVPQRFFSQPQGPSGGRRIASMLGIGVGTAGLCYLVHYARQLNAKRFTCMPQQMGYFEPQVQRRISSTLGYFGGGLALTACAVRAFRFSPWAYVNPWLLFGVSLGNLITMLKIDYDREPILKNVLWLS